MFKGFDSVDRRLVAEGSSLMDVRNWYVWGREWYLDASPYWDEVCSERRSFTSDRSIPAIMSSHESRPGRQSSCEAYAKASDDFRPRSKARIVPSDRMGFSAHRLHSFCILAMFFFNYLTTHLMTVISTQISSPRLQLETSFSTANRYHPVADLG